MGPAVYDARAWLSSGAEAFVVMHKPEALFYFKHLTYNFATWGSEQPVNVDYQGKRYHGYLRPGTGAPYRVRLVEELGDGASRRIAPQTVELDSLDGVRFLHHHPH